MSNEELAKSLIKTKIIHEMDYNDLDKLITSVYGQEFEFVCDQEMCNDTSKTFNIDGQEYPALLQYREENVKKFRETGKGSFLASALMQDMCSVGIIPPGDYLIKVSW